MASLRHRPVLQMDEETSPVLPTRKWHSQGSTQVSQPRRSPSRWCVLRWAVCALQRCAVSLLCSMHMELSGKCCAGMRKPCLSRLTTPRTVSVFTPVWLHLGIGLVFSLFAGVSPYTQHISRWIFMSWKEEWELWILVAYVSIYIYCAQLLLTQHVCA